MKNKVFFLCIALVLVTGLVFGGCAAPAPALAPAPAPAPTPTPAPEVINLRFSGPWPEPSPNFRNLYKPIMDEIEEKSNGRIKFTYFGPGVLGGNREQYDIARTGKADLVTISTGYTPGRFPMSDVFTLPLGYPTTVETMDAVLAVCDRIVYKDFPDTHPVTYYQSQHFYLYTNKKVRTLEDFKGLKTRVSGGVIVHSVEVLGGTPVQMGLPDVYLATQTGVVDAGIYGPSGLLAFKLQEVVKHEVKINLGHTLQLITFNLDTWKKIPNDLKSLITTVARKAGGYEVGLLIHDEAPVTEMLIERGGTSYTLPPREEGRWVRALKPVVNDLLADLEDRGLPSQELLNIVREEMLKREQPFPF